MTSRDTAIEQGKSSETAYVVGPVAAKESNVAQSLLDKQRKLASQPSDAAAAHVPERDKESGDAFYNRIHGTRAVTPGSIARAIEDGIKKKAAGGDK